MMRFVYGCLLFWTLSGVYAQQSETFLVEDKNLLNQLEFRSLLEDRHGNLWLGTRGKGLFRLSGDTLCRVDLKADNIDFNGAASITEDDEGRLFFTGRGVLLYSNASWQMLDAGKLRSTVVFNAYAREEALFFASNKGVTIISGDGETSYLEGNSAPPHPVVHDVRVDKKGSMWLATRKTGLQVWYSGNTSWTGHHESANCRKLLESRNGDIWVGSTAGVMHYDQEDQHLSLLKEGELLLPEFEDARGTLWFSSESLGVWTCFQDNWVQQSTEGSFDVIQRKNGTVWSATSQGLIEIKPKR